MADIKAQDSKHEVTVKFLDPVDFEFIVLDSMAWKQFIDGLTGPIYLLTLGKL